MQTSKPALKKRRMENVKAVWLIFLSNAITGLKWFINEIPAFAGRRVRTLLFPDASYIKLHFATDLIQEFVKDYFKTSSAFIDTINIFFALFLLYLKL